MPGIGVAAYGGHMAQRGPVRSTPLDEQVCSALYAASRAMTERGDTTVTGIGQALQLETGRLSPLLKRLEALGLVTLTRQARDERSVLVALTPEGQALEREVVDTQKLVGKATGLRRLR